MSNIRQSRRLVPHSLLFVCLLLLASCGSSTRGDETATQTVPTSASPTTAPLPTRDPATATQCNQLDAFGTARPTRLYNLDFPEDGVATATITSPANSSLEVVEYTACITVSHDKAVTLAPMDLVLDALRTTPRGWKSLSTFPFDGTTQRDCAIQQVCLAIMPDNYLLLEQARVYNAHLVTFHLRLAGTPPLVRCDPILFPYQTYPTTISPEYAAQIPLPPVTQVSEGYGDATGLTTYLCSAGSAQSVADFMQHNLPLYGWKPVTIQGVQLWKTKSGTPTMTIRIYPITDPLRWSILEYFPYSNL